MNDHDVTFLFSRKGVPHKTYQLDPSSNSLRSDKANVNFKRCEASSHTYSSLSELRDLLLSARDEASPVQHKSVHAEGAKRVASGHAANDFEYSRGLVLDVDLPLDNGLEIDGIESVVGTLSEVMPEFSDVPYLWNYSSSSLIFTGSGQQVSTKLGLHIRFMTADAWTDSDLKTLARRLVIAGYGYLDGSVKTIIDDSSQQPNRLFFEASPVLGEGLYRPPYADDFNLVEDGKAYAELPSVPELTDDELKAYERTCDALGGTSSRTSNKTSVQVSTDDFGFDPDMEVVTANGASIRVGDVTDKTAIHCPFREDRHPSAFVELNDQGILYISDSATGVTYWQRPKILLDDVKIARQQTLNVQYLSGSIDAFEGLTFLKSGIGTGKTSALREHISRVEGSVIYICHREALARQVARQLDLHFYKDGDVTKAARLAICVDSLWRLLDQVKRYDNVVIDESDQLVRHLTGDTLKGGNGRPSRRNEVQTYLSFLVRKAHSVLSMDAHLSSLTKNFIGGLRGNASSKYEVVNTYQRYKGETVELLDKSSTLIQDFYDGVKDGYKVALASDTKDKASATFSKLARDFPTKVGLLITADGVSHVKGQQSLNSTGVMDDLNDSLKDVDYFVYSPSVGTGYSIDKVTFDAVYGHFSFLVPTENVQQLGRIREAGIRKVFFQERKSQLSPNTVTYLIEKQWEHNQEVRDLLREDQDIDVRRDTETLQVTVSNADDTYLRLYATVKYYEHLERLGGARRFTELLKEQGYSVKSKESCDATIKRSKKLSQDSKTAYKDQRTSELMNADAFDDDEARRIRLKSHKSLKESRKLERFDIENFYNQDLTVELLEFDNNGTMRDKLPKFEGLLLSDKEIGERDKRNGKQDSLVHHKYESMTKVLFEEVCEHLHITDFRKLDEAVICNQVLKSQGFDKFLKARKRRLNATFKVKVPKNFERELSKYVVSLFKEFGIKTSSKPMRLGSIKENFDSAFVSAVEPVLKGDERARLVTVDKDHFEKMLSFVRSDLV